MLHRRVALLLMVAGVVLGKPHRNVNHQIKRSVSDSPNSDIMSAPFAPGSSRDNVMHGNERLQSSSEWQDQAGDEPEDSMAAPNFHSSKVSWNRNSFRNSAVIRSDNARMGPHHQKLNGAETSKKHRRRSFFDSKEGPSSPSNLATSLSVSSKNTVSPRPRSKPIEPKPEILPTPLPAAGLKPTLVSNVTKTKPKAVTLRKRSESKASHEAKQRLISELGEILKDDEREKAKRIPPDVKRQASAERIRASVPDESQQQPKSLIKPSSLPLKSDRKAFNEWLKNEYFKNMALSMSTAKRKRTTQIPLIEANDMRRKRKVDFDFAEPDFETEGNDDRYDNERSLTNEVEEDNAVDFNPETAQRRLQVLENAVLSQAVKKVVEIARETAMAEAAKEEVAQHLAEAFYLDKLQQAIEDKYVSLRSKKFPAMPMRASFDDEKDNSDDNYEDASSDTNQEEDEQPEEAPIKRGNGNLAEALSGMSTSDSKRRQDRVDCPELRLITSDCSSLDDILPPDTTVSPELKHTCNKHEVCYTCGEAFGLTSSVCDVQFLRETAQICSAGGDKCEPHHLTQILAPLRERRVFYKRSINPICYKAHVCIGRFLTDP